jgi:hypothetical protein
MIRAATAALLALTLVVRPGVAPGQQTPLVVVPPPPPAPPVPAIVAPPPPPAIGAPSGGIPVPPPRPRREALALPVAALQTLEKITGRVRAVEVVVGQPTRVGTLEINARTCRKRPQEETPESAAFLEINERPAGEGGATRLFTGWMFASSPAVSALEHPVYDVWLVDCRTSSSASSR